VKHETVEKNSALLGVLIAVLISVGGLVEIVPLAVSSEATQPAPGVAHAPGGHVLQLPAEGGDAALQVGEHGDRMLRGETERYGHYSLAGESVYDHPFQFGSKRTGPDLARVGTRYSDEWHRRHLLNPRDLVPESNMPAYPWLESHVVDANGTAAKMKALRMVGVPYTDEQIAGAAAEVQNRSEMDALIAFLQGLGTASKTWK